MSLADSRSALDSAGVRYSRDRTSAFRGFAGGASLFLNFAENDAWGLRGDTGENLSWWNRHDYTLPKRVIFGTVSAGEHHF